MLPNALTAAVQRAHSLWSQKRVSAPQVAEWIAVTIDRGSEAVVLVLPRGEALIVLRFLGRDCDDNSVVARLESPAGRGAFWFVHVTDTALSTYRCEAHRLTHGGNA